MTTYKVMTTMKASAMEEAPDERYAAAKRGGYSVAHLGPGSATEQEMLETWLLLEVGLDTPGSNPSALCEYQIVNRCRRHATCIYPIFRRHFGRDAEPQPSTGLGCSLR